MRLLRLLCGPRGKLSSRKSTGISHPVLCSNRRRKAVSGEAVTLFVQATFPMKPVSQASLLFFWK